MIVWDGSAMCHQCFQCVRVEEKIVHFVGCWSILSKRSLACLYLPCGSMAGLQESTGFWGLFDCPLECSGLSWVNWQGRNIPGAPFLWCLGFSLFSAVCQHSLLGSKEAMTDDIATLLAKCFEASLCSSLAGCLLISLAHALQMSSNNIRSNCKY